ncbi:MAG: DUF2264 domain-containing protein, partial [Acidobacteriota bacterium]|nr:DUF2264 domain-containing protein [Acidobacteriota bacterium]
MQKTTSAPIERRDFLKGAAALSAASSAGALPAIAAAQPQPGAGTATGADDRAYWIHLLDKICAPVLRALSENKLKATMPVDVPMGNVEERRPFIYLAALANVLAGIAPWLETGPTTGPEGALRRQYADWARAGIRAGTDPGSPDFMDF